MGSDDSAKQAVIAMHSDLPRILRKDTTEVTELIAKYRGYDADLDVGLSDVVEQLVQLRIELEGASQRVAAHSGAGGPVGPNAPEAEPTVVSELGKAVSLPVALVAGGFVSSLEVAKKGIAQGYVEVDGEKVESAELTLELGEYVLKCGEVVQSIQVK